MRLTALLKQSRQKHCVRTSHKQTNDKGKKRKRGGVDGGDASTSTTEPPARQQYPPQAKDTYMSLKNLYKPEF